MEYPVFSCPNCGPDPVNEWEKWWDRYSGLHRDPEKWSHRKHGLACLVGFMCKAYADFYGCPYRFSYTSAVPFKDKDFVMARRILAMFDGNAKIARNYVIWVYKFKVRTVKYQVTSFGFFASQKFVNEYNQARARAAVPRRAARLPADFLSWCLESEPEIFDLQELGTWNDLNGLVTHVKSYGPEGPEGRVVSEAVRRGMLPAGPEHRKLED